MKNHKRQKSTGFKGLLFIALLISSLNTFGQLKGDHILGDAGLDAGSQAPASFTLAVPVYFYTAHSLRDGNGNKKFPAPEIDMFVTGLGASWVSKFKILGANYGASVLFGFAKNRLEGNLVNSSASLALSDTYFQPIQLGWHQKTTDFLFSYSLYIPTGKYSVGGSDNSGLGMLGNEIAAGTSIYFDQTKSFGFSALFSYAISGKKKDSEIKTGDILSVEGGFGKSFYQFSGNSKMPSSIIKAGAVYYAQLKVTEDQIPIGSFVYFPEKKDNLYALGAEGNIFLVKPEINLGVRWLAEIDAVNRFQGNTFFITLAKTFISKPSK